MKSPEQKMLELEHQVMLLEQTDKESIFFDMMIDMAKDEFKIPIRKKSLSSQSSNSGKSPDNL